MAIALHRFAGSMDTDSPDTVIPKGVHRTARNGIFRGNPGNYRYEAVPGTTVRPNTFLPNTGTNKNIGRHYDPVNQQLYSFNWNSTGFHGIYIYSTLTQGWQVLIQTGTNTVGDPLNFSPGIRIHSIDILYGDGTAGNLLFFVDSLKRPRKLNIQRLLAGAYIGIKDDYLKVIKSPLIGTPKCVYENDTTVTANNVINALFNFAVTPIYDDFEEGVLGSAARQPLPSDPFDPTSNVDKSRNSRIAIYIPTGDQNIKKLRIYGKQTKDGVTSDWFIVDTLIKADLGIANNTIYRYLFFNNGNYVPANVAFTTLDQDYVPQQANTESLIDGHVITYGGITEGYDFENPSFGILTQNTNQPVYNASGTLFFAATNGVFTGSQPQITIYLTGVGTNDGFGNPITLEKAPVNLFVRAKSGITNINFTYFNAGSSHSIPTLLAGLQAAAITAGWIFVSSTTNSFTIYYPTGNVVLQSSRIESFLNSSPYQAPVSTHFPEAAYSYGVLYRDGDGRTNGVISNVTGNIKMQIQGSVGQIPEVLIGLGGFTPPTWAVYYEIVRTDNLTYQKYLDWISGSAYSNNGTLVNTPYAYFGISNISDYNTSIKATEGVIGYTFTSGDRVRILGRYDAGGAFVALNFDYAILGVTTNPLANGQTQQGSFLQIYYPTNDINPNYKFDGTVDFQNYKILIYNYKAYNPTNQNVYWQIGEQYGIGNPGTVSAYHMGNVSDNQVNLTEGDIFYRSRTIPITNTYYVNCGAVDQGTTYGTEWVNPGGGGVPVVDNAIYSIYGDINRNAGLLNTQYPLYADLAWTLWNKSGSAFNVRVQQEITVTDKVDPNGQWGLYIKVIEPGNIVTLYNVIPTKSGLNAGVANTYKFDVTFSMPGPSKMWLISYAVNEMLIGYGQLQIDIIRSRTIQVFDSSFSDIYALRTNSDNKPNVIDVTAKRTYFSTLFRFSQPDELGTEINNSSRFYFNNFDEFDKSFGDIIRMRVRQRELRIFQSRRCGRVGIYQKFISGNTGNNQLITTDTIITPNNISYFEGEYGIGNQPDGLCSSGYDDYFPDPVKGYWCRLSLNGIIPISELYKVQTYAGTNLPNYLNNYNNQYGGNAVILGEFNFCKDRDGEAIFVLQSGFTHAVSFAGPGGGTITQPAIFNTGQPPTVVGESIAFNERQNSWTDFYDFSPDSIICCEDTLFSFVNGILYSHDNEAACANFYGTQYPCNITIPVNDNLVEKKTFLALTEVSNVPWACPSIYTDLMSYPGQRQESNLVVQDFAQLESEFHSSFWMDIHSQKGQFNGNPLKGSLIVAQFQVDDPSNGVYLTDVSITYIESHRNNR